MIRFDVLTLFPGMISPMFEDSILKRAIDNNLISINLHDFREFSKMKHHNVDDTPYGGGAGMETHQNKKLCWQDNGDSDSGRARGFGTLQALPVKGDR